MNGPKPVVDSNKTILRDEMTEAVPIEDAMIVVMMTEGVMTEGTTEIVMTGEMIETETEEMIEIETEEMTEIEEGPQEDRHPPSDPQDDRHRPSDPQDEIVDHQKDHQ